MFDTGDVDLMGNSRTPGRPAWFVVRRPPHLRQWPGACGSGFCDRSNGAQRSVSLPRMSFLGTGLATHFPNAMTMIREYAGRSRRQVRSAITVIAIRGQSTAALALPWAAT